MRASLSCRKGFGISCKLNKGSLRLGAELREGFLRFSCRLQKGILTGFFISFVLDALVPIPSGGFCKLSPFSVDSNPKP